MPIKNEFPTGNNNTGNTKEARLAKLKKDQRERQLSDVFEKFSPLSREVNILDYFESEEWEDFSQKLHEVLRTLLSINHFENNQELKKECEEILLLLDNEDRNQSKKYEDLINKLWQFFIDNKVFMRSKLP